MFPHKEMHVLNKQEKEFLAFKSYFFSDRRALSYIQSNFEAWDIVALRGKLGTLGLSHLVPDYKLGLVLQLIKKSDVKQAVFRGDYGYLDQICHELSFLEYSRFIVSKLLSAHRPEHFPVWDTRRVLIREWETNQPDFTYTDLKVKIDDYKNHHGLNGLDYYHFNKLLWYCE